MRAMNSCDLRRIYVGTLSADRERMLERTRLTLALGLCSTLAAMGCSNDGPSSGVGSDPVDGRKPVDAPADQPSNGAVEVDEAGLRGVARDGELELSIPIRGLKAGKGSVIAELIAVDRSKVQARAELDYRLDDGERSTLSARLRMPKDVKEQADLVAYSVRVHDGDSSLQVTRSLLHVLSPIELRLEGPSALQAQKQGSYRVRAQDPLTRAPLADVPVSLVVKREDESLQTLKGETDDTGSAIFDVNVEEAGSYLVTASSGDAESGVAQELSGPISVKPAGQKVLLTTDKPIYQPGQTMHLRAMALKSPGNTPLASTALLFEVSDGKGNKVFKKQRKTDEYGIASVDFKLASLVNMGSYKLQVSGEGTAEKTVEVSRYVLPKFELRVTTDRPWYSPGRELRGTVDSRYFFGKTLSGADVTIEGLSLDVGAQVFQRVMGKTDAQGHFAFTIQLPEVLAGIPLQGGNALVTLRTRVMDSAGQVVEKDTPVTVAAAGVRLSLVPEAAELVTGIENRFHLFATDPMGAPIADAKVELSGGAPEMTVHTDAFGHAELRWTVESDTRVQAVMAELTTREGEKASGHFSFNAQGGAEHVLVRTDKSLYALGESVKVQVLGTRDESRAYLDWLNDGQVVDMRTLELKDGIASFEVTLDPTLIGENRIEAYVVDEGGNAVRAGRTIVVNREGGLRVALSQDKAEYRPGEPAQLTLSVTDETGKPTPAALGVQIVDEAVFGLIDARPGLLRTFFELEESFAMPAYEIHVPAVSFEKLLFEDALASDPEQKRAAQVLAEAQLSALRGRPMMGLSLESWSATANAANLELAPYVARERKRLVELLKPAFTAARASLAAMGCTDQNQSLFCPSLGKTFLQALNEQALADTELVDFWGNAYAAAGFDTHLLSLSSTGPGEMRGDIDDLTIQLSVSELGGSPRSWGSSPQDRDSSPTPGGAVPATPAASPGAPAMTAAPSNAEAHNGDGAQGATTSEDPGPRVRKEFPETLYVNPALITDAEGKVSVSLDMADSITSWRVSALANAKGGALGGGQAAVTVFQDFFVDINFPAELTRGDQVEFPIVVYNYLKSEQTVRLELEPASWFSALGSTTTSLTLGPDQVQSTRIAVRVEQVGTQTLTLRGFGTNASDAVARSVRVVPDGVPVQRAQSGSLEPGEVSLGVDVPTNAVEGSPQVYLDVYPAFTSQAVQGLDSMLAVPSGCFEQTTSTTWPNVLVTSYLEQTKQNTPEIQLKAESLISAGYQRLVTFEHSGGGFSWFGESDGMPDVSVTAFGLMEFADMAKVSEVDPALIARTQTWLAAQQAGDGSFAGGTTEFFSFQTSALRNTAFVVWALAESGYGGPELELAVEYVRAHIDDGEDTYSLALAANALAAANPSDPDLDSLLERLDGAKTTDGAKVHWASGTQQTSFYGGGSDSDVSTTALIAHVLIRAGARAATAKGALEYVIASKDAVGNFGSTQASIWSLKALMLAASRGTEGALGNLAVRVDGEAFSTVELAKDQWDVSTRIDLSSQATRGAHTIELEFSGSGQVSYNLVSSHHLPWAESPLPTLAPLEITVGYDRTQLAVDDFVTASLRVNNLTAATQNMLLVTVGIPPGFDLQTAELEGYVQAGQISRFERTAKQLILYLTQLGPLASQTIQYRLRASMPVRAADGGSQVHLYYQPDQKAQASSTQLVVTGG